ncbi:GDSL-type esterase/lipase family protein [Gorillibacterium sp. CAU 1737]|uniref:SGNH/GDSL hydrolase family protein n=1 Tax=Gorillibacterium sp. CAU 1737 TaxID=3140362 RepID=UPI003261CA07
MDAHTYRSMLSRSLLWPRTNARLLHQVRAMQECSQRLHRFLFLGGSITSGYTPEGLLTDDNYPCRVTQACRSHIPGPIEMTNLGMSSYNSDMGLASAAMELERSTPTTVFVEFAVNNGFYKASADSFESLIRKLLLHDEAMAVIIVCTCLESGYTCEPYMAEIAQHYDLPLVSVKSAWEYGKEHGMQWSDYSWDHAHPTSEGHRLLADAILHLLDETAASTGRSGEAAGASPPLLPVPAPCGFGNSLENLRYVDHRTLSVTSADGFEPSETHERFPYGWRYRRGSGGSLTFSTRCTKLFIVYELSHEEHGYGELAVQVDGAEAAKLNGMSLYGWHNPVCAQVMDGHQPEVHEVVLRMAAGSEQLDFVLLGVLIA